MDDLFYSIINMSLTASYVIIGVLIVRLLLRKSPKIVSYLLWSVVAFRLIVPFSIESAYSLLPKNVETTPISNNILHQEAQNINNGLNIVYSVVDNTLPVVSTSQVNSVNSLLNIEILLIWLWVSGIVAFMGYYGYSILKLRKQLKCSVYLTDNIYEASNLKTPFVLGIITPKIYLPKDLSFEERKFICLHEQIHINRKDYIVKSFGFVILSVHWFNPLVWISFILMNKDMEYSCDERVLKELDVDIKKSYAMSLVNLASERTLVSRIAFGEGDVKGRVKNVLNYKRRNIGIMGVSVICAVVIGVGLMSNPVSGSEEVLNDVVESTEVKVTKNTDNSFFIDKETVSNYSYINENNIGSGIFYLGMSSDEVFEFMSSVNTDLYFNMTEDGTYDDKMLRLMDELPNYDEVMYEYSISDRLHLYFDKDKKLVQILVQQITWTNTYSGVEDYYQENKDNIFYSGEFNTEKGLNLLSTKDDLIALYGQPDQLIENTWGTVYVYELKPGLYLKVVIVGGDDNKEFVYRITYMGE